MSEGAVLERGPATLRQSFYTTPLVTKTERPRKLRWQTWLDSLARVNHGWDGCGTPTGSRDFTWIMSINPIKKAIKKLSNGSVFLRRSAGVPALVLGSKANPPKRRNCEPTYSTWSKRTCSKNIATHGS